MGHHSPNSQICATCEFWVAGRELRTTYDMRTEVRTFQANGFCTTTKSNRCASGTCGDFLVWSTINQTI